MTEHVYLSTGCLHGRHDYCQSMTGYRGQKRPAKCKFCDAKCQCPCHSLDDSNSLDEIPGHVERSRPARCVCPCHEQREEDR